MPAERIDRHLIQGDLVGAKQCLTTDLGAEGSEEGIALIAFKNHELQQDFHAAIFGHRQRNLGDAELLQQLPDEGLVLLIGAQYERAGCVEGLDRRVRQAVFVQAVELVIQRGDGVRSHL